MPTWRRASNPPPEASRSGVLLDLVRRYPGRATAFYADVVDDRIYNVSASLCDMRRRGHVRSGKDGIVQLWWPERA